jgi:hypothetical protein|tara:strand:- start:380 stop:712 length:333 start_codon:yes stop_codon:yes gene_type:complete
MLENKKKYFINLKHHGKAIVHLRRSKKITRTDLDVVLWCYHYGVFSVQKFNKEFDKGINRSRQHISQLIEKRLIKRKQGYKLNNGAFPYYLTPKGLVVAREYYRVLKGLQ